MKVFTRVDVPGRGFGRLAMDNGDGSWNVEFEDETEGDVPDTEIRVCDDQCLEELWKPEAGQVQGLLSGIRVIKDPDAEPKPDGWVRFACFSDTHGLHDAIPAKNRPAADVLLHAGDFTNTGELEQIESFSKWLRMYPAKHRVVIAGNHDITLHEEYYREMGATRFHRSRSEAYDCEKARDLIQGCCTYLEDSSAEVCGYSIYGSPWQPAFCDWAFNLPKGRALEEKWKQIPACVDILITHGPPEGFGDRTSSGLRAGCGELRAAIEQRLISVNLSGHIHEGYGCSADCVTLYINASTCTHAYKPTNAPIVFDLPPPQELRELTKKAAAAGRHSLAGGLREPPPSAMQACGRK
jgi:Icc-related predicted phosphoesterase